MKPPIGLANSYALYLRARYERIFAKADLARGWERNPVHWHGRLDARTGRTDASDYVNAALARFVRVAEEEKIHPTQLENLAREVDRHNKRTVGIPSSRLGAPVESFRDQNLALIKSLDRKAVGELRAVLEQAEREAWRVEAVKTAIQERFEVTRSHANLIARDQVLKLNGQITEYRQTAAGVTQYEWSTSNDERVREGHADLDGTIQDWASPPIVDERTGRRAHPGQDISCRCVAIPVISS